MSLVSALLEGSAERVALLPPCMDPEPANGSTHEPPQPEPPGAEAFDLSGPSLVLIGFSLALATLGFPLAAVLTERPPGPLIAPIAQDRDGSSLPPPLAVSGSRQPGG